MEADEPPARQKQRDIQQNCQNTHRQHRQQDIDGLRQTCDATHAYGICRKEPVKGQRENHRTQRYDGIAFQLLFQKLLPPHCLFVFYAAEASDYHAEGTRSLQQTDLLVLGVLLFY